MPAFLDFDPVAAHFPVFDTWEVQALSVPLAVGEDGVSTPALNYTTVEHL